MTRFAPAVVLSILLAGCEVRMVRNEPPPPKPVAPPPSAPPPAPPPPAGLPDRGPSPSVNDNNRTVRLERGIYRGALVIDGNHNTLSGTGEGETVIEGDLRINGNTNKVSGLTVRGAVSINGNTNEISRVGYTGKVSASGNQNKY